MTMSTVRCIGCGALVPDISGPTHEYMESSPGCWWAYGQVLARAYADPGFRAVLRLTVDTYAVQHPGRPNPNAIQSVCGHLVSLCLILEKGASLSFGEKGIRWATRNEGQIRWLTPPDSLGEITIIDIDPSASADEHAAQVRRWAHSAWAAWAEHHHTIREWTSQVLGND